MPIDFSPLQQIDPAGAFFRGREAALAEQDRNMLRQQQAQQLALQQENALALREQRMASAAEAKAKTERAAQRQTFLTNLSAKMAEGGYKLDRPTLGQVLQFGMQSGEDSLIKLATEGMRALDEDERDKAEMARIRPAAGGAAPSIMRQPTAAGLPAAPAAPTNMLAGTPFDIGTTQPAPVNALVTPPAAAEPMVGGFTRSQINEMAGSSVKNVRERGERLLKLLPKEEATPSDVAAMKALGFPLTAAGYAQYRDAQRQDRLKSPEEEAQVIRIAKATQQPKEEKDDPRTVVAFRETDAAGNVTLLNKFGDVITPSAPVKGKPTATFEKTTAQRRQLGIDLDRAITELTDASKNGGLIDRSTGSGAGQLRDVGMGFFGASSSGSIAASELAPIADLVLKMVPRFEGPQSNKDTTSYERAAGELANTGLPSDRRKAAAKVLVRLMTERKGQFVTREMAAEGVGGAAPTGARPSLDSIFK